MSLDRGIANSLDSKLDAVLKSLGSNHGDAATDQLHALINQIKAQTGKKISQDEATQLLPAVQHLIDSIRHTPDAKDHDDHLQEHQGPLSDRPTE